MRHPSLAVVLIVELPLLIVSMALMSWGLYAFTDAVRFEELSGTRKGFESGDYGFNYGTQVITLTSTRRILTDQTVLATPTVLTYTLYPYAQGTIAYTSIYSKLGYIPPAVTSFSPTTYTSTRTSDGSTFLTTGSIAQRDLAAAPTVAPRAAATVATEKRSWANNDADRSQGLYGGDGEGGSFFRVVVLCFALVVAFQALRLLASIVYLIVVWRTANSVKAKAHRGVLIMMVTVTTLAWLGISAAGLAAFVMFGEWYSSLLAGSPGAIATLAFYAANMITTFVVLVWSCVALHSVKKQVSESVGYHRKEDLATPSRKSQASA